ncbi:MAG: hypothetical protein E6Q94_05665 [Burkholderiaceae bacterium]|nr:MAG: hypothetical protein E6Q94_05665 [Burkholderiaceae bacterium]
MNKPHPKDHEEKEWHPEQVDTRLAVNAVLDPGHNHNYGASLHLWKQAADGDFNDDVIFFLGFVASKIVELDEQGRVTPAAIKNACGLSGTKRSRIEGAAIEYVRSAQMFEALDENDNPIAGDHPIPNVAQIQKAIDDHPEAQALRQGKRTAAAKKAYETMRKRP